MSKNSKITPDELELFRNEMGDVRRLNHDKVSHQLELPTPVPRKSLEDETGVMRDSLSDEFAPTELEAGEELSFLRPGLQKTVLRKLRRGQFSVGDELDLHGYTGSLALR